MFELNIFLSYFKLLKNINKYILKFNSIKYNNKNIFFPDVEKFEEKK